MLRHRLVVLALVAALGAPACGGQADTATPAPSPAPPPAPVAPPTAAGAPSTAPVPEALQFSAEGVAGGRVTGADYAGRDVALWFWAPW